MPRRTLIGTYREHICQDRCQATTIRGPPVPVAECSAVTSIPRCLVDLESSSFSQLSLVALRLKRSCARKTASASPMRRLLRRVIDICVSEDVERDYSDASITMAG